MHQSSFLDVQRIVNVASVPKRSPFRYPGGKTWLIPRIREWLTAQDARNELFLEPFAGGGIVSLTVAAEQLAGEVHMVELDSDVAAVWQLIITEGEGPWLANRILTFELSAENVVAELAHEPASLQERAWRTILKNRVNRGGILAPGAGLIRFGEQGKGLFSRWYPETLARRINDIHHLRNRLVFHHGDGMTIMQEFAEVGAVTFIDPPYTAGGNGKRAGSRLYTHNALDHEALFALTSIMTGDFLMTYDNDPEVIELAAAQGFVTLPIPMKNTHHAEMTELLIGRRLDWARDV